MDGMQVENQHRQLGEEWIQAVTAREFDRLAQFCQPNLQSQILTPKRFAAFEQAGDVVARYQQWFGDAAPITIEQARVDLVGERLTIFYRFLLQEQGVWERVEQQLYCTLQDGLVGQLQLLCSGFHPAGESGQNSLAGGSSPENPTQSASPLRADAVLEIRAAEGKLESTCAILTPAIKTKLRELESGQVLEVRVDDPDAKGDIEAWCRLSGNRLLEMSAGAGPELRFLLQKK